MPAPLCCPDGRRKPSRSRLGADGLDEILLEKPVRPVPAGSCLVALSKEVGKGLALLRTAAAQPPVFENRPLRQPIRPADHQDAADQALAESHAPEQLHWKNQDAPKQRGRSGPRGYDRRCPGRDAGGEDGLGLGAHSLMENGRRSFLEAWELELHQAMASSRIRLSACSVLNPIRRPMVPAMLIWSVGLSTTTPRGTPGPASSAKISCAERELKWCWQGTSANGLLSRPQSGATTKIVLSRYSGSASTAATSCFKPSSIIEMARV